MSVWNIIDAYFKDNPNIIVKHHIESFDDFILKGIPRIFRENNPVVIMHNQIKNTTQYERMVHLYMGGKEGNKIYYGKPVIYNDVEDKESDTHYMYPNEARLKNMTYAMTIHYDVECELVENDGKDIKRETILLPKVFLGRLPIMLQSNFCILKGLPREARYHLGECRNDPGGYFIVDGKEKVVVSQEIFGNNLLYFRKNIDEDYSCGADIRMVSEDPSKPRRNLSVRMGIHGNILVFVPNVRKPLPLFIIMRALGIESDKDIIETCLLNMDKEKMLIEHFIPCVHDAGTIFTQKHAIQYISTHTKGKTTDTTIEILTDYLLPNIGYTNFIEKAYYIGYIVKRMLYVAIDKTPPTDRDSFQYKRVQVSGVLLYELFQEYYKLQVNNIRTKIDTEYHFDKQTYYKKLRLLIDNNNVKFFEERIVEKGMRKAFKGQWGSQEYTSKDGVIQDLNRLSFFAALEHLRKVNLNMDSNAKVVAPRYLHSTQYGLICPVHTPDGGNIGFHKHMALGCLVTPEILSGEILKWLQSYSIEHVTELTNRELFDKTKVFVNGKWIGVYEEPEKIMSEFRSARRKGEISLYINCRWNIELMEIHFATDAGRLTRMLFYVENGESSLQKKRETESWNVLTKGTIEYMDTLEAEGSYIAMYEKDIENAHTHVEVHPSLMFSILGNMVIYPECNPLPRDLFSCGQTKQAVSLYSSNYLNRIDTMGVVLNYGENPLVRSRYMNYITKEEHPYGENAIVAIACFSGYNVEDALIFNEASIKRGLFHTTYYKMYEDRETSSKVNNTTLDTKFMNVEDYDVVGKKPGYDYSELSELGIIKKDTLLDEKKIIIGKATPSTEKPGIYVDTSLKAKKGQIGVIDQTYVTEGEDGFRIAKVRVREFRVPNLGDKFCSRAGQKGTIGMILPECDMPYTEDGIRPDIIVNPHALPKRMTLGHIIECIVGQASLHLGGHGECTPFTHEFNYDTYGKILQQAGFHHSGNHVMYNGMSGEQIEANIFLGPNYYLRLKHMVKDKINYRARGPRTSLTRQTVQGRANDGGLRVGEMERDCLIAHGLSHFIQNSMMERGDVYKVVICNQSGAIAVYNSSNNELYSPHVDGPLHFKNPHTDCKAEYISKFGRSFSIVQVPYAFKLLLQELQVMNVNMYIVTADNIDQLYSMNGKQYIELKEDTITATDLDPDVDPDPDTDIEIVEEDESNSTINRKIIILVPYMEQEYVNNIDGQDRKLHLDTFISHMRTFIQVMVETAKREMNISLQVEVHVIEQTDKDMKFNRGSLLNIGFVLSDAKTYSGVILHDVDLLPKKNMAKHYLEALFSETSNYRMVHLAHQWPRYQEVGSRYVGGVLIVRSDVFQDLNGFPTFFEGWGGEDEALLKRLERMMQDRQLDIPLDDMIKRPSDITYNDFDDLENLNTMKEKMDMLLRNPMQMNNDVQASLDLDKENGSIYGLKNIENTYEVREKQILQNQSNMTLYKIKLNKNFTSFDIISSIRGDENMEIPEDSDDDDERPPITIMDDVVIPESEISKDVEVFLPTLTEKEDVPGSGTEGENTEKSGDTGIKIIA